MTNNHCKNCLNYLGDLSCVAFTRIPNEILLGESKHEKPLPNQSNDVVFEPIDK